MISITFGNKAENGVGMEMIGRNLESGFSLETLQNFAQEFENTTVHDLSLKGEEEIPAYCLVIKNGVQQLTGSSATELFNELKDLDFDKKCLTRGKVKNKLARWNLCFADFTQEPDYEAGKGRVYNFTSLPLLNSVREALIEKVNDAWDQNIEQDCFPAELNYYYDMNKCGIGFHGDAERKIVLCVRLAAPKIACSPMLFQWYQNSEKLGERFSIELEAGDLYILSEKAVGSDWKKRKIPTLRHATGSAKYTDVKKAPKKDPSEKKPRKKREVKQK